MNAEDARKLTAEADETAAAAAPTLVAQACLRISDAAKAGERHVNLYYHRRLEAIHVGQELKGRGFKVIALSEPLADSDPASGVTLLSAMHTIGVSW